MDRIYNNILETVGSTPVVRINKLAPEHVNLYVKVEAFNPMASVKDRLALGVIEAAERDGSLKPGQTVVEATSGNTGIGLAMVCAQKGYPLVVVMAENFSVERRRLMRFLGARVVLTPAAEKGTGMLAKAVELAEKHGWFLARQFENEANADIHSKTTAPEIPLDSLRAMRDLSPEQTVLIAGPTASGKSALALEIADRQGGVIVNADASQIYDCWRVITARPSVADEAAAPHRLYGHVSAHDPSSVGHWLREIEGLLAGDARLIIVGGTGLYFSALTQGLVDIPSTPPDIRAAGPAMQQHQCLAPALRIGQEFPV